MIDDMGIFRTSVGVRPTPDSTNRRQIDGVMVDTGSEYNWFPEELLAEIGVIPMRIDRFERADRRVVERPVGFPPPLRREARAFWRVLFRRACRPPLRRCSATCPD